MLYCSALEPELAQEPEGTTHLHTSRLYSVKEILQTHGAGSVHRKRFRRIHRVALQVLNGHDNVST